LKAENHKNYIQVARKRVLLTFNVHQIQNLLRSYFSRLSIAVTMSRGRFEGERVDMPFPLLKYLRTHYSRHCESFSSHKCTIL